MHTKSAPVALREDLEIAPGLGGLDHPEGVRLAGNRKVERLIARDLQEEDCGEPLRPGRFPDQGEPLEVRELAVGDDVAGAVEVLGEARARTPVIPGGGERGGRHGVDRVGPDQFLDVQHVTVAGTLRPRAGPREPLRLRAALGQGTPARTAEQLPVSLVGELRVRNRNLAAERLKPPLFPRVGRLRQPHLERRVDRCVDPADEEAGHAGELPQVARLARETGVQERVHHVAGEVAADHPAAEHEQVHVVVLHALVRGVGVVAEAGPDAGDAVGRHRGPDTAAEDDPAVGPMLTHCSADRRGVVRVVDGIPAVGPHVQHLVVLPGQEGFDGLLQLEARVSDPIATRISTLPAGQPLGRDHDILRRESELLLQLLERRRRPEGLHPEGDTAVADVPRPAEG